MKLKLTKAKYQKLSDICSDIALVSLASVVIPYLLDTFDPIKIILGLVITSLFWFFSLWLAK